MQRHRRIARPEVPLLAGLLPEHLELIAGCAENVRFLAGESLFHAGDPAEHFFVVRAGNVALETRTRRAATSADRDARASDVLGWSWLFPPYRWLFDARALEGTRAAVRRRVPARQVRCRSASATS